MRARLLRPLWSKKLHLWSLLLAVLLLSLVVLNYSRALNQAKRSYLLESRQTVELDQSQLHQTLRLAQEMLKLVAEDPYTRAFVASGGTFPPHSQSRIVPAFEFLSRRLELWGLQIIAYHPEPRLFWSVQGEELNSPEMERELVQLSSEEFRKGDFLAWPTEAESGAFFYCYPIRDQGRVVGFVSLLLPKRQLLEGVSPLTKAVEMSGSGVRVANADYRGDGDVFQLSVESEDYPRWELEASRPDQDFSEREQVKSAQSFALFSALGLLLTLSLASVWRNRRQVLRESRAKSEFLATLAHEIRNPLGGILSLNKLARKTVRDPVHREYLDMSSKAAESTLRLLQDTLEMSRVEAGTLRLSPRPTDVRSLLHEATKSMAVEAQKRGLVLLCEVSLELPNTLFLDGARLRQVVLNLLGNALKFTDSGSIVLGAEWNDGTMTISVADTGRGIPKEQLQGIFQAYRQVAENDRRGVGLGLHISRQIVLAFGSDLELESELGLGSTFRFSIRPEVSDSEHLRVTEKARDFEFLVSCREALEEQRLARLLKAWDLNYKLLAEVPKTERADTVLIVDTELLSELPGIPQRALLLGSFFSAELPELSRGQVLLTKPVSEREFAQSLCEILEGESTEPFALECEKGEEGPRILLAEDSPIHQRFTTRMLESAGYQVELAEDGEQALELALGESFDLLLLDVGMPGMSGLEVASSLRQRAATKGLPIVGLTGHALGRDRERCLESGMNRYLAKPYDESELLSLLSELLVQGTRPSGPHGRVDGGVFDPEKALSAVGGDPERLVALIRFFLRNDSELIKDLRQSVVREEQERCSELCERVRNLVKPFEARAVMTELSNFKEAPGNPALESLVSSLEELRETLESFVRDERSERV